jgi:hypothetical protein
MSINLQSMGGYYRFTNITYIQWFYMVQPFDKDNTEVIIIE